MKRATDTEVRPLGRSLASRYAGQTVIAIGAHPDDLEIGIGGMLAKLQLIGARVIMCVASIPKDFEVSAPPEMPKPVSATSTVWSNSGRRRISSAYR